MATRRFAWETSFNGGIGDITKNINDVAFKEKKFAAIFPPNASSLIGKASR